MTFSMGNETSHKIIQILETAGHEAVLVGGAVRDYVRGEKAEDIDIATSATPQEVKAFFSHTIDVGIDHGTVLVLLDGESIEVTTYRYRKKLSSDFTYTLCFGKSLQEDLAHRDFTMNALAMTKENELIDPFGGVTDIENRLIRAVGDPQARIQEDSLRMLRAIRFSSSFNYKIETNTEQAIRQCVQQIQSVSIERIKVEFDKIFLGENPKKAFDYLSSTGLSEHLPFMSINHQLLNNILPFESELEGWIFLSIEEKDLLNNLVRTYKLSNKEKKFITSVIEALNKRKERMYSIEDYYEYPLHVLSVTEKFFHAIYPSRQKLSYEQLCDHKNALPIQSIKDLAVDGKDLINWSNARGGKWVGNALKKIEKAVLYGTCKNNPITIKEWFMNDFKFKR